MTIAYWILAGLLALLVLAGVLVWLATVWV
ncbi:hypothetical protein ABMA10_10470 [Plantibacter sp. RU18]